MFDDALIESAGKNRRIGGWITAAISVVLHLGAIGAILAAGKYIEDDSSVIEKPIAAFVVTSAPPPPPPPPPPAASNAGSAPRPTVERQVEPVREPFQQPRDVPQNVPEVAEVSAGDEGAEAEGGQVGGVKGGVAGGVAGGTAGGEIGGQLGGQIGGQIGGQVGGQLGGTGTTPGAPLRVGGNVTAPVVLERVQPRYTEIARKARIQGPVIVEAIINHDGDVVDARVIKGLPMGLDAEALAALKRWKFKPGALNGRPVPVYFTLVINFQLQS